VAQAAPRQRAAPPPAGTAQPQLITTPCAALALHDDAHAWCQAWQSARRTARVAALRCAALSRSAGTDHPDGERQARSSTFGCNPLAAATLHAAAVRASDLIHPVAEPMNIVPATSPPRRLGAGAGWRPPACWRGCTPPAACTRRWKLDDALATSAAARRPAGRGRSRRAAGRCHCADKHLCIVADYDCDGATACAVAVRGLRLLGATAGQLPGARPRGRRLRPDGRPSPQRVAGRGADVLITVDNGIASIDGVAHASALGLQVLVTDHHLPARQRTGTSRCPRPM